MVYDGFHTGDLREACAELTVWQREGLKTNMLGGIRLSCGTGARLNTLHFNGFIQIWIERNKTVVTTTFQLVLK